MDRPEWQDPNEGDPSATYPFAPIPLHERTWRHPSELGFTQPVVVPASPSLSRVMVLSTVIIGVACAVGFGLLLLPGTGPKVEQGSSTSLGTTGTNLTLASRGEGGERMGIRSSLAPDGGAIVVAVLAGSPADRAGLHQGDVIVHVGETPVDEPADLALCLDAYAPGAAVPVDLRRDGEPVQLEVVLASATAG